MLSIALSAVAAIAAFTFGLVRYGWGSAIFMALLAGVVVLVALVRTTRKPVQAALDAIEEDVKAQRFKRAIERLRRARRLGLWQPLLASQIDEQIGVLHYAALKDLEGARPYLERARHKGVQGWTMLAASLYRRGRYQEADHVFERATRRRPKEGLIWAAHAWSRIDRGRRTEALEVLARGRKRLPTDERLRRIQLAVQNGKRPRMRSFGADWYALELERMPEGVAAANPAAHHPAFRRGRGRH
jgi:tetratricopeptide (TPR) repeat protein